MEENEACSSKVRSREAEAKRFVPRVCRVMPSLPRWRLGALVWQNLLNYSIELITPLPLCQELSASAVISFEGLGRYDHVLCGRTSRVRPLKQRHIENV